MLEIKKNFTRLIPKCLINIVKYIHDMKIVNGERLKNHRNKQVFTSNIYERQLMSKLPTN